MLPTPDTPRGRARARLEAPPGRKIAPFGSPANTPASYHVVAAPQLTASRAVQFLTLPGSGSSLAPPFNGMEARNGRARWVADLLPARGPPGDRQRAP